jgi:hypothetical protein
VAEAEQEVVVQLLLVQGLVVLEAEAEPVDQQDLELQGKEIMEKVLAARQEEEEQVNLGVAMD